MVCGCFKRGNMAWIYMLMKQRKAMEGTKYLGKVDDAQKHILKWERPRHLAISISKVLGSVTMLPLNSILYEGWQELRHANGYGLCGVIAWRVSSRMRMAI